MQVLGGQSVPTSAHRYVRVYPALATDEADMQQAVLQQSMGPQVRCACQARASANMRPCCRGII